MTSQATDMTALIAGPLLSDAAMRTAAEHGLTLVPLKPYADADEMIAAANAIGAQAIVVRMGVVSRAVIEGIPTLRIIAKHGVGVDGIDRAAASARGIPVVVAGGANAQSVAEQALALLMSAARSTAWLDRRVREGHWDKPTYAGTEITGKSIGLVGLGAIGRAFLHLLAPFGGTVRIYDPYLGDAQLPVGTIRCATVRELLEQSDIVSLHCPLTPDNRGFIDADALAAMRPGSILLNTARGELIDETALVEALQSGPLAGAGLDTFASEPPAADHPFWALDNLVVSPHVGANTREARIRVGISVVDQIAAYLTTGAIEPRNLVNTLAATAA
ncbi:hydroxyacid dehydrogenase [Sphingomonas sp. S6]|uniref:hydroxyacid dehydrogenase n=1 Tax=Sphingomonas sp. S6 TaxID=3368600 RepID=UPI0028E7A154|nr:hydroxyacid dehydrogenase [uncultured Sphingomonas sp.]